MIRKGWHAPFGNMATGTGNLLETTVPNVWVRCSRRWLRMNGAKAEQWAWASGGGSASVGDSTDTRDENAVDRIG